MPNVTDDRWVASIEKFREVTKWIMAGIGAMITLILGSSPATGLGSLEPGWRLASAVLGAAVGLLALIHIFWAAVAVLRSRLANIVAFVDDAQYASERAEVDQIMRGYLPTGIGNTTELVQQRLALPPDARDPHSAAIRDAAITATRVAAFVIADRLFKRLCQRLAVLTFPVVIGLGLYEWAVNPSKADAQASKKPLAIEVTVSLKNLAPTAELPMNCAAFKMQGQALVCVAELPPGSSLSGGATGRTYAAVPPTPTDLIGMLTRVIETTAKKAKRFSPLEFAQRATEKFIDSASDELGRKVVGYFFSAEEKLRPDVADSMILTIEGPPPQQPEPIQIYPFAVNSALLPMSEEWRRQLSVLVDRLRQESCKFGVRGFADRRGSARDNLYLSLERANSVAHYLESQGVPRQQITTDARGAFGIGFETDDGQDLAKNRRVEVLARCE
jgi:outer membrane protein OmpA-like peptidoglycan-associated protein